MGRLLEACRRRPLLVLSVLVVATLLPTHLWVAGHREVNGWGWDESMHAALPAARMVVAVEEGQPGRALTAVLDCERYPFVFPLILALGQGLIGVSQDGARWVALGLWALLGMWGVARLGRLLAEDLGRASPAARAEHQLLPVAILCLAPLPWRFASTLFLEVPFLVVSAFALGSWLGRRREGAGTAASLRAGVLITLAVFTKFNYGLLFCCALGLDGIVDLIGAARRGDLAREAKGLAWCDLAREAKGLAWCALPLILTCVWWLLMPWPGEAGLAARHQAELYQFLRGNLESGGWPWSYWVLAAFSGAAAHPALTLFLCLAALASLRRLPCPALRTLWILFGGMGLPIALHPFLLDRFLIPVLLPFALLASVGLIPKPSAPGESGPWRATLACALFLLALGVWVPRHRTAQVLGLVDAEPSANQVRLVEEIDERWSLFGQVPTSGLPRAAYDELLDLVYGALSPGERVAWVGMSSELSPAALHLGLLERGGSPQRFLRDAHRKMDLVPIKGAPDPLAPPRFAEPVQLDRFLEDTFGAFDLILVSTPPDLKDRAGRRHLGPDFHDPLVERLGYRAQILGSVTIPRPELGPDGDLTVVLKGLRR